jgi:hypothetical protein
LGDYWIFEGLAAGFWVVAVAKTRSRSLRDDSQKDKSNGNGKSEIQGSLHSGGKERHLRSR